MKYYELGANTPGISIEEDIFHIKTKELKCGVDLSGQDIDKKIVIYPKHISITDWSTLHAFIVTERFKKIIQSANCGNIQFLPFVAKREDGKEEHELYIVNYIDRFDALVREHSKIIPKIFDFEEDYIVIACVDESKLGDLDIFTLKGDNENVYVSERLQKIIEENKLTGVDLKKIRTLAKETKAQNVEKVTQKPIKINNKPINSFEELLDMALAQTPKKVIGFCVNLYEGENNNFYAELVATNSFGSQNEDWACDEIFASREDNMEYEFISNNYETALDKIKTELVKYLASGKYSKKLKQAKGIAYGFVDGDLTLIYER